MDFAIMQEKIQYNSPIKQRILFFAESLGISKRKFYEIIGVSRGTLEATTGITEDIMAKFIVKYPLVNPDWLLTGKEPMLKQKEREEQPVAQISSVQGIGIPLVSMEVAAGFGSGDFAITDQDIEANYVVPDFNGIDFMIRVKGSSMYPKYSSGDIIACRKLNDSKFIQWNKCHVIATREQGLLVKRLKKGSLEKNILAISDNKEYDPFEIPIDEVTGIALVIGVIRLE
jgi:phage repressor protein C with HTH and peptisase S24 domain